MEKHTVSRLVGAPPGYVGYDEGGQLTEAVRRRPYSVILFDEIEKAHPDVFNALLQILDDGRLTDGKGRTVDFSNTVIIMTSNVGTAVLHRQRLGFVPDGDGATHEDLEKQLMDELRRAFRPEFLNRIDEIIVFDPLDTEQLARIVDLLLGHLRRQVEAQGMKLEITKAAEEFVARARLRRRVRGAAAQASHPASRREPAVQRPVARRVRGGRHHQGRCRRWRRGVRQGAGIVGDDAEGTDSLLRWRRGRGARRRVWRRASASHAARRSPGCGWRCARAAARWPASPARRARRPVPPPHRRRRRRPGRTAAAARALRADRRTA